MKKFWSLLVMAVCVFAGAAWAEGLSREHPLILDKEAKQVTILARVNGKYFDETTMHAIVFEGGKVGDKALFASYADPLAVYEALKEIGAQPGDNVTLESKNLAVEGSAMRAMVSWEGAPARDLNELVIDEGGRALDLRFGGNAATAKELGTGCVACFVSCPAGIMSNASYLFAPADGVEPAYRGNKDLLPPDGTEVQITFSLAE